MVLTLEGKVFAPLNACMFVYACVYENNSIKMNFSC